MRTLSLFTWIFAVTAMLGLGGCSNTFHGVGQDMERAGRTIQETF